MSWKFKVLVRPNGHREGWRLLSCHNIESQNRDKEAYTFTSVYSVFRYEPPAIGLGYLTAKANQLFPGDTMTGPAAASGSSSSANATAKAAVSVPSGIDNSPAPIPVGNNTALNQTAVDAVADNGTVAAPSGAGSTPANSSGPSSTPSSAAGQGVTTFGVQALAGLFGACAALAVLL